jgi:flavin-dependent dehydrogenase
MSEGAIHKPVMVDQVQFRDGRPVLYSKKQELMHADLVVGAFGVNSATPKQFAGMDIGYQEPPVITAAIAEIHMGVDNVAEYFGNSIHLFLLPDPGLKFAAMIPKGAYVTLCILGSKVNANTVSEFLEKPLVKGVLPKASDYSVECRCLPKMNVGAPKRPFSDRMVMCGDAGSTRLFKDGLGAAYLMGKAAAKTAVFQGVSSSDFQRGYYPTYKSIIVDNYFGHFMYAVIGLYRSIGLLTSAMVKVVEKEQCGAREDRILSGILWDMFTGNERYKTIFAQSLKVKMHRDMWGGVFKTILRRKA